MLSLQVVLSSLDSLSGFLPFRCLGNLFSAEFNLINERTGLYVGLIQTYGIKTLQLKLKQKRTEIKFHRRLVTICGILNLRGDFAVMPVTWPRKYYISRPPLNPEKGKGNWIRLTLSYTNEDEQPRRIL